jgi:hypothetical protein
MLNSIISSSVIPNFTQVGQEMQKALVEIRLPPSVKYDTEPLFTKLMLASVKNFIKFHENSTEQFS